MVYHLVNEVLIIRDGYIIDNPFYKPKFKSRVVSWLVANQTEVKRYIYGYFNQNDLTVDDVFAYVIDYFLVESRDFNKSFGTTDNYSIESYVYYLLKNNILKAYMKEKVGKKEVSLLDETEKTGYKGVNIESLSLPSYSSYDLYSLGDKTENDYEKFITLTFMFDDYFKIYDEDFVYDFFFYGLLNDKPLTDSISYLTKNYNYDASLLFKQMKELQNNLMYTIVKDLGLKLKNKELTKENLIRREN